MKPLNNGRPVSPIVQFEDRIIYPEDSISIGDVIYSEWYGDGTEGTYQADVRDANRYRLGVVTHLYETESGCFLHFNGNDFEGRTWFKSLMLYMRAMPDGYGTHLLGCKVSKRFCSSWVIGAKEDFYDIDKLDVPKINKILGIK